MMIMELTEELKELFTRAAKALSGSARRIFMADVVEKTGWGGQRQVEEELEWNRGTIQKGQHELQSGFSWIDNFSARGRKSAEAKPPNLLDDIRSIADFQSQTDATFKTTQLYTRLTAAEMRKQLVLQKNYAEDELPTEETIRVKM